MRIPKSQIALPQLPKPEVPPGQEFERRSHAPLERTLVDENNTSANIKNVNSSRTMMASRSHLRVMLLPESAFSSDSCFAMTIGQTAVRRANDQAIKPIYATFHAASIRLLRGGIVESPNNSVCWIAAHCVTSDGARGDNRFSEQAPGSKRTQERRTGSGVFDLA